jgi:hypothetical protein
VDITTMTLTQFLCNSTQDVPATPYAFVIAASAITTSMIGAKLRDLDQQYAIHELNTDIGDAILLYNGSPVGFYWGETIAIDPAHQGKKLSVPLVYSGYKKSAAAASDPYIVTRGQTGTYKRLERSKRRYA